MEHMGKTDFGIEKAKRGEDFTFYFEEAGKKKYLLSKYNPREDAIRMLGEDLGNKESVWIILGFGFGYMIEHILQNISESSVIIAIEPEKEILKEQIKVLKTKDFLDKNNIKILSGTDWKEIGKEIRASIPNNQVNNIKIVYLKGYMEHYTKYYKNILEIIDDAVTGKIINKNTISSYAELFTRNTFRNREAVHKAYDLRVYENHYQNIPALVVSGGPSLNKNIEYIKDFKGIIFTGTRTIGAIEKQGIKPDFLVCVDPTDKIYKIIGEEVDNEVSLITMSQASPEVLRANKGRQYLMAHTSSMSQALLGDRTELVLPAGGSVATLCLSSAVYMGCNPIIFIGQDLANTNMQIHADICSNEHNALQESNSIDMNKIIERGGKEIEGYCGGKVWSTSDLIFFLHWIEDYILNHPHVQYINATEGGALIHGAENRNFKEVVEQYKMICKPEPPEEKQLNIDVNMDEIIQNSLGELKKIDKALKEAEKNSDELEKEYTVYKGTRIARINKLVKKLDKSDEIILHGGYASDIAGQLYMKASLALENKKDIREQIKETPMERDIRIAKYNYEIYKAVGKAIEGIIKIINEELERSAYNE